MKYEKPEWEIILLTTEDIVTASIGDEEHGQLDIIGMGAAGVC